jgi:MFS family permease
MRVEHGCGPARSSHFVRQVPIFYGWIIIMAGTLGLIMTSPGQTYGVSPFVEHFIADLGLSRSLISTLFAVGPLSGSLALPFIGRGVDRRGPRFMVILIAAALGLSCIAMGLVQSAITLCLGFVALRTFGKGGLDLVSTNAINQWWVRRRGMAMGVAGLGMSLLGFGTFPIFINRLIAVYGWRWAYMIVGFITLLVLVPTGFLLFRDHPEDYGLEPDGHIRSTAHKELATQGMIEENWTAREATRTSAFWVFLLGIGFIVMVGTGLFFHLVRIFADNGLNATIAAAVFVPIGLTQALVIMCSGILVDRVPVRILLALALVVQAASLGVTHFMRSVALALAYGILLGITGGLLRIVGSVGWANYFGRRHLGGITGIASVMVVGGSALGPVPLGIARDVLGSYQLPLTMMSILSLVLAAASLSAKRPTRVG